MTHDRWFARGFDRFLVFGADGGVYESDEPVWDEGRVVAPAEIGTFSNIRHALKKVAESCKDPYIDVDLDARWAASRNTLLKAPPPLLG